MHSEDLPTALSNRPSAAKVSPAPAGPTEDVERPAARRPRLELTATQILAGVAASVTAAILGSRLGVAGTVVGAALASGISIAAGAVFAHSIHATRHGMRRVVDRLRPDSTATPATARAARPRVGASRHSAPTRSAGPVRRPWWSGLAVGVVATVLVFAGALALITGIEVVKGSPLSGGAAGGLSVLGGASAGGSDPDGGPRSTTPATSGSASGATTAGDANHPVADPTTSAASSTPSAPPSDSPTGTAGAAGATAGSAAAGSAARGGAGLTGIGSDAPTTAGTSGAAAGGTRPTGVDPTTTAPTTGPPGVTATTTAGAAASSGTAADGSGASAGTDPVTTPAPSSSAR
jgi:hypothetical protein